MKLSIKAHVCVSLLSAICAVSLIGQTSPPHTIDSGSYSTFASACSAAVSANVSLVVGQRWTAVPTQTCNANLIFVGAGVLQPSSGATLTLSGGLSAPMTQIFDPSLGGNVFVNGAPFVYPQWFGAGFGAADDAPALQAWLTSWTTNTQAPSNNSKAAAGFWSAGTYKILSPLTVTAGLFTLPNLFTAGASQVTLDASALGSGAALTVQGGSGSFQQAVWQGITVKGAGLGTGDGVVDSGAGFMLFQGWRFTQLGVGFHFLNTSAGPFTEGVKVDATFAEDVTTAIRYSAASGGDGSFRGSGLVGQSSIQLSNLGPAVLIDAGTCPYLAPMNTFLFNQGGYGAPVITSSGMNIIVTNSSWPAAQTTCTYTITPFGQPAFVQ